MANEQTRRHGGSARDVVLSLAVLLVPIAIIVGLTRACTDITPVDPSAAFAEARADNRFPVVAPQGLDSGWRCVRAQYGSSPPNGTLRVGYLTPDDGALQLVETNVDPQALLPQEFGDDVVAVEPVDVDGTVWRTYRVRGRELALVLTTGDRTTLIQGQASVEELRILAASLR